MRLNNSIDNNVKFQQEFIPKVVKDVILSNSFGNNVKLKYFFKLRFFNEKRLPNDNNKLNFSQFFVLSFFKNSYTQFYFLMLSYYVKISLKIHQASSYRKV